VVGDSDGTAGALGGADRPELLEVGVANNGRGVVAHRGVDVVVGTVRVQRADLLATRSGVVGALS